MRQVGLNFGAPGDRRAPDGTLWLDVPKSPLLRGPSLDLAVVLDPVKPERFVAHASTVADAGDSQSWIVASGINGLLKAQITLAEAEEAGQDRLYTVRLHFAEPHASAPGRRVFDIALQGAVVAAQFDIVRVAGPAGGRGVVLTFGGIKVKDVLELELRPVADSALAPLICGAEIRIEE